MADAAAIIQRIRSFGANVMLDRDKLIIVNKAKLPEGALAYIRQHGRAIADFLAREGDIEERAAALEYRGGHSRADADRLARLLFASCPEGANSADWTWFVNKALEIMDAAPVERAA